MLNQQISKAIAQVEASQWTIDDLEDAITWAEEDSTDEDFLAYCRDELEYYRHKLQKAKVRLDICVRTFNKGGWSFE